MTCSEIQANFSLYLYGELDFATEELIEIHLVDCALCQFALNREKQWHADVNRQQRDVQPEWLAACRRNLLAQIASEPTTAAHARHRIAGWWQALFDIRVNERSYRLAAISSLVVVGFAAGRMYNSFASPLKSQPLLNTAGILQPSVTQVQEIRPESGNRVRIILNQMQVREISGSRDDDNVRGLLVAAIRGSMDPGVRMDSVEMLAGQESAEIETALLNTIKSDPNAAVRAKAIESLRSFPANSAVRTALEFALAHDQDPTVRAEAIDVLIPVQGPVQLTPQMFEVMSNVMRTAQADDYVRLRCAQVLNQQSAVHHSLANDTY